MTFTKDQKRFLSRAFAQEQAIEATPLWDEPRTLYQDDTRIEFGFFQGFEGCTDEQVDEFFDTCIRLRIPANMYWDCTGAAFTQSISWRRNPNGDVSFVHRIGYDY